MSVLARWMATTLLVLVASISFVSTASARVDCGNGKYCPPGNACLKDDQCGVIVEAPPGSFKTQSGTWCEPGYREHRYKPGACMPTGYSDCRNGTICPAGTTCNDTAGSCDGGGAPKGPVCGNFRCEEGRICSSAGRCMNTAYFQDCGGGIICSKNKACGMDGGCAIVGIGRTQQMSDANTKKQNSTRPQ